MQTSIFWLLSGQIIFSEVLYAVCNSDGERNIEENLKIEEDIELIL